MDNYRMKSIKYRSINLLGILLLIGIGCFSCYTKAGSTTVDRFYNLTVLESKLIMIIPKGNLKKEIVKSYRSFKFRDGLDGFNISGWFEPDSSYTSMKENWEGNIISWKKTKLPPPQKIQFSKQNAWEVVAYDMGREDCIGPNLKAHLVKEGTWIDLHLSFDCYAYGDREKLLSFLKNIKIQTKKG